MEIQRSLLSHALRNRLLRITLLIALHLSLASYAQNLISNPGFEEVTGCPSASAFLRNVNDWHKLYDHRGTPDQFYGNCDYNGVENSMAPGQKPYNGVGYVGCFAYGDNLREYMTTELIEPMVKDSIYTVSFYVLPAIGYGTMINSFGVHFSQVAPCGNNDLKVVPLEEHVGNPEGRIIMDTIQWTKIEGTYKARGGERFATFGNFRSDEGTQHKIIKENCIRSDRSYILVDGVEMYNGKLDQNAETITKDTNDYSKDTSLYIDVRPLKLDKSFTTSKHRISISIWDDKRVDGDSVHLLINDSLLLKNHLLTKRHTFIELDLESGEYLIKLVAINLGAIPPNTAAIKITDHSQQRTYVLKSDMISTDGIRIIVQDE